MLRRRYVCGVLAVCAVAATAPRWTARAQQPAAPGAALLVPLPMPEILKQYQSIPAERLKNPPDGDWPMFRRTYDGWGYSPLSQIDTGNVKRLQPAWVFSTVDGERTRGAADRRQRRDVRVDAGQSGARH